MSHRKIAFITGITGQDGSYLAQFLLDKNYKVHGMMRRASLPNTARINHIKNDIHLHYGDMTDGGNVARLIHDIQPDEIYNMAAQSDVKISFDMPEYSANTNGFGVLRILEAMRASPKAMKLFQASTSELFGATDVIPQSERTPFYPRSPYAAAKLYAYWMVVNYREAYNLFACNGIMFNHESPHRGEEFVTRKITKGVAAISRRHQEKISLGNLNAKRDWGHARDYVRGAWMMLQTDKPDDYVLASGQSRSVRDFVNAAFHYAGITIEWRGEGADEHAINTKTGQIIVDIDPQFFRPTDVEYLIGDSSKALDKLGWSPKITFDQLVADMMDYDLKVSQA